MVGATGFEPATSCSQSKCSTRLSYAPTQILQWIYAVSKTQIDNLILQSDTVCMKTIRLPSESGSDWQKTPYTNLIRYKPSQTYFARFRVKGKLIRRTLKTKSLSV